MARQLILLYVENGTSVVGGRRGEGMYLSRIITHAPLITIIL